MYIFMDGREIGCERDRERDMGERWITGLTGSYYIWYPTAPLCHGHYIPIRRYIQRERERERENDRERERGRVRV